MRTLLLPFFLVACGTSAATDTSTGDTADTADTSDTADTQDSSPDLVAECETTACGGDPTGEWELVQTCFDDSATDFGKCAGTTIRLSDFQLQGSLSLGADGGYTNTITGGTFSTEVAVPAVCNPTASCADVQATLTTDYTCADDGAGGCACASTSPWSASDDQGTWSAADTDLAMGDASAPFCTDSDELWVDLTGAGFIPLQMIYARK